MSRPEASPLAGHAASADMRAARTALQQVAMRAVAHAVRNGALEPLANLRCADCGAPAECYDHRDYRRPLVVEPLCSPCNTRRPPALPWAPGRRKRRETVGLVITFPVKTFGRVKVAAERAGLSPSLFARRILKEVSRNSAPGPLCVDSIFAELNAKAVDFGAFVRGTHDPGRAIGGELRSRVEREIASLNSGKLVAVPSVRTQLMGVR